MVEASKRKVHRKLCAQEATSQEVNDLKLEAHTMMLVLVADAATQKDDLKSEVAEKRLSPAKDFQGFSGDVSGCSENGTTHQGSVFTMSDDAVSDDLIFDGPCDLSLRPNGLSTEADDLVHPQVSKKIVVKAATSKKQHQKKNSMFKKKALVLLIVAFLPWRQTFQLRQVNHAFMEASFTFVRLKYLPNSNVPSIFIPYTGAKKPSKHPVMINSRYPWWCAQCGAQNEGQYNTCINPSCKGVSPVLWTGRRVFLGQLRRDNTEEMMWWLFNRVCNVATHQVISYKNHISAETGRGKGCAWAYVAKDAAQRVLDLHHRSYFSCDGKTEGLWMVSRRHGHFLVDASRRGRLADSSTHLKQMPRQTLVVEPSIREPQMHSLRDDMPVVYSIRGLEVYQRNNPYGSFGLQAVSKPME